MKPLLPFGCLVWWLALWPEMAAAQALKPPAGQIVIDREHPQWLMRQDGKHFFICGPGVCNLVRSPAQGTLSGENNDRTYTPRPEYIGNDEFVWMVNDGVGDSQPAKVIIRVFAQEQ
jgi:hypothetical protein